MRISALANLLAPFITLAAVAQASYQAPQQYPLSNQPQSVIAADLNQDGYADLAYVTVVSEDPTTFQQQFQVMVRLNQGDGTFGPETSYDLGSLTGSDLLTGDFNGDGILDLAVNGGNAAVVRIFYGNGDGTFQDGSDVAVDGSAGSIAVGDFNNDGWLDLAALSPPTTSGATDPAGKVTLLSSNGDGTFSSSSFFVPGGYWAAQYRDTNHRDYGKYLVAGDWNADGNIDLALAKSCAGCSGAPQEATFQMFGDGAGNFTLASQPADSSTGVGRLRAADVDLDGKSDIFYRYNGCHTACTGIVVLYSNGDGTATARSPYSGGAGTGVATDVIVTDVDNDGIMDIVAATMSSSIGASKPGGITVLRGLGGRNFGAPQTFGDIGSNYQPRALASGLFDSDGQIDVAEVSLDWSVLVGGEVSVFLNNSSGGSCFYPTDPSGVNICTPHDGDGTGTVQLLATGKGISSPVLRMEVWLDGVKLMQIFNDEVNATLNEPPGQHTIDVYAVDYAGQNTKSSVTIGSVP